MVTLSHAAKALQGRYSPRGNANFRTQFLGDDRHKVPRAPDSAGPTPVAYLVEQAPHTELRAHFHVADQFQIFVGGAGRIGAHRAVPGCGHFVGPYSGYGPIVGGDEGIAYMTLRTAWDGGAQFLPERIEALRPHRGQRRESLFQAPTATLPAGGSPGRSVTALLELQGDGLAAWSYLLAPGTSASGPDPAQGGGQFWLVMDGSMVDCGEGLLPRLSLAFVAPGAAPYVAAAGPEGLHALVLQFPATGSAA